MSGPEQRSGNVSDGPSATPEGRGAGSPEPGNVRAAGHGGPGSASREDAPPGATDGPAATRGTDRRTFLKVSGAGAGLAATGGLGSLLAGRAPALAGQALRPGSAGDVVVVGAGAFGGWTAYYLQQMGAQVTLVDLYGPGNSRSTSGSETRGVRTSYPRSDQWTVWAQRAIRRWEAFDEEHAAEMGGKLFFNTGDIICRDTAEGFFTEVKDVWDRNGGTYEILDPADAAREWPVINFDGITHILHEPGAGVVRARAACRRVAHLFEQRGGRILLGRADLGERSGGRALSITVDGQPLSAERYVFALGPWFATTFTDVLGDMIRIPMGHTVYFGPPPGDHRFSHPNMPSWNFPGVTGWPCLPPDHRGFRVRTGGRAGEDPDTSDRWVPPEGLEQPRQVVRDRFPLLADAPVVETRACHYEIPSTRDWIIDRHPELANVWFAGGGSAEGFKFGPVIGELIASRVLETGQFSELDAKFRLTGESGGDPGGA